MWIILSQIFVYYSVNKIYSDASVSILNTRNFYFINIIERMSEINKARSDLKIQDNQIYYI